MNFSWVGALRDGEMSINRPLSGLGWRMKTSLENLNRMYYLLLITYYLLLENT